MRHPAYCDPGFLCRSRAGKKLEQSPTCRAWRLAVWGQRRIRWGLVTSETWTKNVFPRGLEVFVDPPSIAIHSHLGFMFPLSNVFMCSGHNTVQSTPANRRCTREKSVINTQCFNPKQNQRHLHLLLSFQILFTDPARIAQVLSWSTTRTFDRQFMLRVPPAGWAEQKPRTIPPFWIFFTQGWPLIWFGWGRYVGDAHCFWDLSHLSYVINSLSLLACAAISCGWCPSATPRASRGPQQPARRNCLGDPLC